LDLSRYQSRFVSKQICVDWTTGGAAIGALDLPGAYFRISSGQGK
jgi:hypothetical protein